MSKKMKAAFYGLAFVAGCEIGIAIQLMKMIHRYTIRESALQEYLPSDEEIDEELAKLAEAAGETAETDSENGAEPVAVDIPEGEVAPA